MLQGPFNVLSDIRQWLISHTSTSTFLSDKAFAFRVLLTNRVARGIKFQEYYKKCTAHVQPCCSGRGIKLRVLAVYTASLRLGWQTFNAILQRAYTSAGTRSLLYKGAL